MSGGGAPLLGAIEAGGTKFALALAHPGGGIIARHRIATRSPEETLTEALDWFGRQPRIDAIGVASFGPIELDRRSPQWGSIGKTPKPFWSDFPLAGRLADRLGVPLGLDTDVNAAALAEFHAASQADLTALAYVTVGTGIGGGLVIDGKPLHGAAHPEMGHLFVPRAADEAPFAGICPYHGACLEGLVSGPAIQARWGASLSELPPAHEAHGIVAHGIAQLCHSLFAVTAVQAVVLGGGVMASDGLLERVRELSARIDGGYLPGRRRQHIRAPIRGDDAGVEGALLLAAEALGAARATKPD
jgi:fructokinase